MKINGVIYNYKIVFQLNYIGEQVNNNKWTFRVPVEDNKYTIPQSDQHSLFKHGIFIDKSNTQCFFA